MARHILMTKASPMWKQKEAYDANENKILKCILKSEPNGMSTKELEKHARLNHDTISRHCQDLVSKGRISKKNKKGRYHLTMEALRDMVTYAWFFEKKMTNKIMDFKVASDKENSFCNINDTEKTNQQFPLFKFANRIGAYITYLMIQAFSPKLLEPYINGKQSTEVKEQLKLDLAFDWIENVIKPINLFGIFLDLFVIQGVDEPNASSQTFSLDLMSRDLDAIKTKGEKRNLPIYVQSKPNETMFVDEVWKERLVSSQERDTMVFRKLMVSFEAVFPSLYENLEASRVELDKNIQELMNEINYVHRS